MIQWIVEKTIEKNPTDMLGTTLFHFAAYKGHFENLINNEGLDSQLQYRGEKWLACY